MLQDKSAPGKSAVFTRWLDAEAIKTPEFALTEWFDEQGGVSARMLFDHREDREDREDRDETINLADEPAYSDRVEAMHRELMKNIQEREVISVASPPPLPKFVQKNLFR